MQKFRVQNYKKIQDSGWIKCGDITTFVGKNESGKSALFRGLSKINPSDKVEYEWGEFPRSRYASEFKQNDWPVSSVEFQLDGNDKAELTKISQVLSEATRVIVTRHYSNKHTMEFDLKINTSSFTVKSCLDFLNNWKRKIDDIPATDTGVEELDQVRSEADSVLTPLIQQLGSQDLSAIVGVSMLRQISDALAATLGKELIRKSHNEMIKNGIYQTIQKTVAIDKAKDWVLKYMPQYIYFDRYDVIDSSIHIRTFIDKINNDPNNTRLRTTKCLFQHVGLDINEVRDLDPVSDDDTEDSQEKARQRQVLMSSASNAMTSQFKNWWEQRRHAFRYSVDGQFFRVWVSDDLDPSEIELEQRSAGLQYFFSFYLVFLVEASSAYKNSILLLDEPGLHYHGTAQKKTVEFLQKISQENQLLYSTHSPFMIDGDRLQDVRVVHENDSGHTLVSTDIWPKDPDSLFPLQAGLGYTLAQTLFYSKYNLIVEGITDYLILKTMSEHLAKKNMTALDPDVSIVPSGGVKNIMPLAAILIGNDLKLAILMDGDDTGINKERQLKKDIMVDCLLVNTFTNKKYAEIEDLFDEDLYISAVNEAYPDKTIQFSDDENSIMCITKRLSQMFARLGFGNFNKWLVASVLIDKIRKDAGKDKISTSTCNAFEKIFVQANSLLKQ